MQGLDRRVEKFATLGGNFGAQVDLELDDTAEATASVMGVRPNTERHPPDGIVKLSGMQVPGPTNYVPSFFKLDELRERLLPFDDEFQKGVGASLDSVLATIWGTSMLLLNRLKAAPEISLQIFRTGYTLTPAGDRWMEYQREIGRYVWAWWEHHLDTKLDADKAVEIAGFGIGVLTYPRQDTDSISLWDRLPYSLFADAADQMVIDHSSLTTLISGLFREVGFLDGPLGNVRGDSFEEAVVSHIEAAGFEIWERGDLISADGEQKRDIDASFVADETLFIVECKAFSQQARIDRGDYAALRDRRQTLEKYLTQAEEVAALISDNPKGRNYELPRGVERIEPCVCTSGVEYIWSTDRRFWINDDVPRIATIEELLELARTAVP